jgi:hypothetical protein
MNNKLVGLKSTLAELEQEEQDLLLQSNELHQTVSLL